MKSAISRKRFSTEFKKEAVALFTEQGDSYAKAAQAVDTNGNNLRRWQKELEQETTGESLSALERAELVRLRREYKKLRMEKDILKKASALASSVHSRAITP